MSSQQQSDECLQSEAACSRKVRRKDLVVVALVASVCEKIEAVTGSLTLVGSDEGREESQANNWKRGPW